MKEKKDVISLLHKIYVAGYVHGDNQGSFPEIGMFDAFNRLIVGESPLLDGSFYDIKDKVDEVLSKFNSEDESPYCPICTGCGEEGCCSPLNCTQNPNGSYCQTYLNDLKFGYKMYNEVSELIKDDPKYKDDVDVIFDRVYNEIYK
jgi:hypothetical protein